MKPKYGSKPVEGKDSTLRIINSQSGKGGVIKGKVPVKGACGDSTYDAPLFIGDEVVLETTAAEAPRWFWTAAPTWCIRTRPPPTSETADTRSKRPTARAESTAPTAARPLMRPQEASSRCSTTTRQRDHLFGHFGLHPQPGRSHVYVHRQATGGLHQLRQRRHQPEKRQGHCDGKARHGRRRHALRQWHVHHGKGRDEHPWRLLGHRHERQQGQQHHLAQGLDPQCR